MVISPTISAVTAGMRSMSPKLKWWAFVPARTDDGDGFATIFVRIVERVLHTVVRLTFDADLAWVALQSDRQDDVFGRQAFAVGK